MHDRLSRTLRLLLAGFVLSLAAMQAAHAQAMTDLLGSLFGDPEATAAGGAEDRRRVPFSREEIQLSFAPLVAETAPAVVNVYASARVRVRSPFAGDPFFEQLFGHRMPPRIQSSLGSGVLVDPEGLIVTNHHVIRDADEVKIAFADGREFESTILLKDEQLDLAILKIEGDEPFAYARLGDSDALQVGDLVLAIGNPFGVGQTTTSGIVSALARTHIGISDFGFFIQTDAAINPGNSGGALINMAGQVIGINTAIFSRSGGSNGIGFAIPSNIVRAVVNAAREGRAVFERPYVGARFEAVTAQIAEALGMKRPAGALVSSVDPDGPAAHSGLRPGDVVLSVNGAEIEHPDALGYRLTTQPVGSVAKVRFLRQGQEREVTLTLIRPPEGPPPVRLDGFGPFAGAVVAELSPRLLQQLGLSYEARGVAVIDVEDGSPADRVGFRPGDIVREVNGRVITGLADLEAEAGRRTRSWQFAIEREGRLLRQVLRF